MSARRGTDQFGPAERRREPHAGHRSVPARDRVTQRDQSLLLALARTRYLSTRLIALLLFHGSRRLANRCARRLRDLGLIRRWVTTQNSDYICGLTVAGRRVLETAEDDLPATIQCPRELDAQFAHELVINSVRVRLSLAVERSGGELCWWRSNRELRAAGRQVTIPDALFAIEWPDGAEQVYALEVEHRTRALQSFLKKAARYAAAAYRPGGIYGERNLVVLVVGADPIWLDRYRAASARLARPITIGFTTLADIERAGPTAAVWQTPAGNSLYLRDLGTCTSGRYTSASENPDSSSTSAGDAAHNSDGIHMP